MMRKLIVPLIALLALLAGTARAQYQPIPNFTGVGAGQNFRSAINNALSGVTAVAPRLVPLPFVSLSATAEQDGQIYWCRDCAQAPICTSGGKGAVAVGAGGQWTCVLGPIQPGSPPVGSAGGDLTATYPNPTVNHVLNGQTPVTTLNGLNALAAATGNYPMGTHKITGLATDQSIGDALSRGNSSLSSLGPPIISFPMGGQTFQSVAAAQASGQPVVAGVTNTAANTQLSLNGSLNVKAQFGAKGDTRTGTDGVTNATTTFTSATANFTAADVGKAIAINGANGFPAGTTIATFVSATTVTTSAAATGSASALTWWVGTNDGAAILAAAQAACPVLSSGATFCTAPVYLPPGQYYTRGLVLNPSTMGGTAVIGLHFICAGANGRGFTPGTPPAPPLTTVLVDNNSASVGIDQFGNASAIWDNCDVRTLTTSTGPKVVLAYGKTSQCDCDVVTLRNSSFESYATNNIGVVFSLGGEDTDISTSQISAYNGGHAVVLSAQNQVGGGITGTGVSLFQPNTTNVIGPSFPVSMLHSNIRSSLLYTKGGTLSSSPVAAALYLDAPVSGALWLGVDGISDTDIQLTGWNDIAVWDGQQGSAGGIIPSLSLRHVVVECLNSAGNGHCQSLKLGNSAPMADLLIEHHAAFQSSRTGTDGVTTTGSATFTSATANFTAADVGSLITVPGVNGIAAGAYIASVTNTTTVTLSVTATTGGTGLSWTLAVPSVQLYNGVPQGNVSIYNGLTSGVGWFACGTGNGARIGINGDNVSCPGATITPNSGVLAAQIIQQVANGTVGLILRPFQDYGTRSGYMMQWTNAAGTATLGFVDANGNANFNSFEALKLAGAPAAIGTNFCQMFVVAGTNAGSCKLQAICGTSATPVTIVDNVGAGC